jgi:hypothetical protein
MREWFDAQLAAGLPAFAGSRLSGTLSVKQELLNELIARWLAAPMSSGAGPGGGSPLDLIRARAALKSASVRGAPGRILVDFEIRL